MYLSVKEDKIIPHGLNRNYPYVILGTNYILPLSCVRLPGPKPETRTVVRGHFGPLKTQLTCLNKDTSPY